MWTTKVRRIARAGVTTFFRNGSVSLASALVLLVTLFLVGMLVFGRAVLQSAIAEVKDKVDITVYFKTDAPEVSVLALSDNLKKLPEVRDVAYTSRDKALLNFKQLHANNSLILSSLDEIGSNPLGAALNIKAQDPTQYESVARYLEEQGNVLTVAGTKGSAIVDKVNYYQNKSVIDRLTRMIGAMDRIGFAVTLLFGLIAILVTFNTIRLAIYTSRDEIAVMKLVGASNNYVRGPFVVEGVIAGLLAGLAAMLVLYATSLWLGNLTAQFFGGVDLAAYYRSHFLSLLGIEVGAGVLLGAFSSWLAVRRYLKV